MSSVLQLALNAETAGSRRASAQSETVWKAFSGAIAAGRENGGGAVPTLTVAGGFGTGLTGGAGGGAGTVAGAVAHAESANTKRSRSGFIEGIQRR